MIPERRQPFVIDEAKFSTQRIVTYFLLLEFAAVSIAVFMGSDQAERSTILQTVINFTLIAVGYWLGASKSMDKAASAATDSMQAKTVQVEADTATVSTPKGTK